MNIEILTNSLQLNIYGFGSVAINKDYINTAFSLSDKMWKEVKTKGIDNKGKNIWVYENNDKVFAGIEIENYNGNILEYKKIILDKYAYYKHIGPYHLIKKIGQDMRNELTKNRYEIILPYIEIYGHWTKDENKLETELFMCLK